MPHRPERNGSAANTGSPMFSRMNGLSEEAAAHIMRPNSLGLYSQASGVVTPLTGTKPWITAQHPGLRGMMPVLEKLKSSDSTDRSTGTRPDEECTVATLATEASADEQEKREATADALLLVSTAAVRHDTVRDDTNVAAPRVGGKDFENAATSSVPLKKRKKHLDFLRRNSDHDKGADDSSQPCHVSPVSHASVEGRTVSHEEVTPERPRRQGVGTERCNSYDSKDSPYQKDATQELLDSSKILNSKEIALPSQVAIPHFPSVLHQVLSDPDFAGSVVTWLPDGEAWKVLRWDALRRQVLPRYFSTLRDEDGSGCGTIDAFLWHLTAWGFEEVKDGSDVGAYRHDLFIRGAQKLSNKMRFTPGTGDHGAKMISPIRQRQGDRTMLQVPTLASVSNADDGLKLPHANKRPRYDEQSSAFAHEAMRRPSPGPQSWMGYRPEDPYADAKSWGHYYGEPPRMLHGAMFDPRFPAHHQHRPMAMDAMAHSSYSTPPPTQVRSGRGAIRVVAPMRSSPSSSPVNTPPSRPSFPISNRGKGRKASVCRSSMPTPDANSTSPEHSPSLSPVKDAPMGLEEALRIGTSVKGVAVAISRKTKRKLPLSRHAEKEKGETSTEEV